MCLSDEKSPAARRESEIPAYRGLRMRKAGVGVGTQTGRGAGTLCILE